MVSAGEWSECRFGQAGDLDTELIVTDFVAYLGGSPYFSINTGYPNASGGTPNGLLIYGGTGVDAYSRGATLTRADLAEIVAGQVAGYALPLDPRGIYVVLTSADVTLEDGDTKFCLTCCHLHGSGEYMGTALKHVFVGNPRRCPTSCAAQFGAAPTPNANLAADAIATSLAAALNATVTNPYGSAWYDRYGLQNSEKCEGTYGATYTVANPLGQEAEANVKLGRRHYLLEQNWVNEKRGRCALSVLQ